MRVILTWDSTAGPNLQANPVGGNAAHPAVLGRSTDVLRGRHVDARLGEWMGKNDSSGGVSGDDRGGGHQRIGA